MKISSRNQIHTDKSFHLPGRFKSLYIHVPFCKNICDYCALYSVVNNESSVRNRYLQKIADDLKKKNSELLPLSSIFIGGGTPSQLTEEELPKLLQAIKENCTLDDDCEFTVECNPSTVNLEKFKILKEFGVNRLSFGAQSTTRKTRNTLGRRTSEKQLLEALSQARSVGFSNINIDLIYGIPDQTIDDWLEDLDKVKTLKVPHISAYSLILEEGTILNKKYDELDDELAVEMYKTAAKQLVEDDTYRYEISNYSQPGLECRHNYHIWKGATYLGIGPAAASFDGIKRWTQIRDLNKWLAGAAPEIDDLPETERLAEIVAFGFRTVNGWHIDELKDLYSRNAYELFSDTFEELLEEGLLKCRENRIYPTEKGLLFADDIAESFLLI
ncbi:MAG: radical SAM family heme chaperone HemW [Lentisphaeraceae bacterium]|nr:radical SAM family heme chaperone HemW [Lentisphaeraceae bacterium]